MYTLNELLELQSVLLNKKKESLKEFQTGVFTITNFGQNQNDTFVVDEKTEEEHKQAEHDYKIQVQHLMEVNSKIMKLNTQWFLDNPFVNIMPEDDLSEEETGNKLTLIESVNLAREMRNYLFALKTLASRKKNEVLTTYNNNEREVKNNQYDIDFYGKKADELELILNRFSRKIKTVSDEAKTKLSFDASLYI